MTIAVLDNVGLSIKIDLTKLGLFFLIFPFLKPDSFRRIAFLDNIFDVWCLASGLIILGFAIVWFIQKKWKPSSAFMIIILLNIWIQLSTCINSGFNMTLFKSFISIMSVSLFVDVFRKYHKDMISSLMLAFEIVIYCNFITFILFPHGMYQDGLYATNWLMGYDNSQIKFYICGVVVASIYKEIFRNGFRGNLFIAVIVMSILFTRVFTAVVGLAIVICILIFNHRERFERIFQPKWYFIIAMLLFTGIVLNNALANKMDFITKYTGKGVTLTTRFDIWQRTLEMASDYFIYGHGWQSVEVRTAEYWNPYATHAHDTYLEYLYQGGIVALLTFILLVVLIMWKLSKCSNKNIKQIFSAVLFAFLIMMIFEAYVFPIVYMTYMLIYHCNLYKRGLFRKQRKIVFRGI